LTLAAILHDTQSKSSLLRQKLNNLFAQFQWSEAFHDDFNQRIIEKNLTMILLHFQQ